MNNPGFFAFGRALYDDVIFESGVNSQQSFYAELLDHHIGPTLCDPHYARTLATFFFAIALESFEVQVSVELNAGRAGELCHAVFAIHLVTLLCHLKFVCHIVREALNIN